MEKYSQSYWLITKFSLLWELLPFYGHLPLWKYLLCSLNKQTRQVWIKNQHAFSERAKNMAMNILQYKDYFDEQFKEYLSDPEILLNNKICIKLDSTIECLNLFVDFFTGWFEANKWPIFEDITMPESISVSYFVEPLYNVLKQMGENQKDTIVKHWKILSSRCILYDPYTDTSILVNLSQLKSKN